MDSNFRVHAALWRWNIFKVLGIIQIIRDTQWGRVVDKVSKKLCFFKRCFKCFFFEGEKVSLKARQDFKIHFLYASFHSSKHNRLKNDRIWKEKCVDFLNRTFHHESSEWLWWHLDLVTISSSWCGSETCQHAEQRLAAGRRRGQVTDLHRWRSPRRQQFWCRKTEDRRIVEFFPRSKYDASLHQVCQKF